MYKCFLFILNFIYMFLIFIPFTIYVFFKFEVMNIIYYIFYIFSLIIFFILIYLYNIKTNKSYLYRFSENIIVIYIIIKLSIFVNYFTNYFEIAQMFLSFCNFIILIYLRGIFIYN